MRQPRGTLTGAQLEIMEVVWSRSGQGATIGEVWQALRAKRDVARTTVQTLVQRLERRGWLSRRKGDGVHRYVAARRKEETSGRLARQFVKEFFGGSVSQLVMSLLGSQRIDPEEVRRLRHLLEEARKEEDGA